MKGIESELGIEEKGLNELREKERGRWIERGEDRGSGRKETVNQRALGSRAQKR